MHLVVGLGNPGPKYAGNRHNVGFHVVERLADGVSFVDKHKGRLAKVELVGRPVQLLMPQTFMNLSGESVQKVLQFFSIPADRLVVVHDELDLAFEDVRIKVGGGLAGHNGLRSIAQHCGGPGFVRVRVGIGRPPVGPVDRFVLSDFSADERARIPDVLDRAATMVRAIVEHGAAKAMNDLHAR
ncbi:MAG: aminoacyl-tRNA hydrolase [Sandaracinus sp.]|nr:aminoacyl-tRNA hydrolase [Sandaracinus sp.]MCB9612168.1 aminoacyl-tRNA hydrolase [Sandaracinus sp.]MCB9618408.1 aminoacyl-tRNA hydrolase [Sandaracinus sp.]